MSSHRTFRKRTGENAFGEEEWNKWTPRDDESVHLHRPHRLHPYRNAFTNKNGGNHFVYTETANGIPVIARVTSVLGKRPSSEISANENENDTHSK